MAVFFLPKSRFKKFSERVAQTEDVVVIDVSGKTEAWSPLASTFNHGEIPVPGMPGVFAKTVEGIWDGLKRFEHEGENLALLDADKPKKRRLTKDTGAVVGYLYGTELLRDELAARRRILVPAYTWMVKNCPAAKAKFEELVELSKTHTLHVYDGGENGVINGAEPYACAALLAEMLRDVKKKEAALA